MFNLDWKLVKNVKNKLNNLEGWKAAIWVLHQPFLQHGAASKLKEVNLVGFLHQQTTGLFQQVKSGHRKAWDSFASLRFGESQLIFIICSIHFDNQLFSLLLYQNSVLFCSFASSKLLGASVVRVLEFLDQLKFFLLGGGFLLATSPLSHHKIFKQGIDCNVLRSYDRWWNGWLVENCVRLFVLESFAFFLNHGNLSSLPLATCYICYLGEFGTFNELV